MEKKNIEILEHQIRNFSVLELSKMYNVSISTMSKITSEIFKQKRKFTGDWMNSQERIAFMNYKKNII